MKGKREMFGKKYLSVKGNILNCTNCSPLFVLDDKGTKSNVKVSNEPS